MLGQLDRRASIERNQRRTHSSGLVKGPERLENSRRVLEQSSRFGGIALRQFCARNQGLCEVVSSTNGFENPMRVDDLLHSNHG
jgi:hypothetical protein